MEPLLKHVLREGDRALILAQRLLEVITHAPEIEEDLALANLALDLIGQARNLYSYAGEIEGLGHDEDYFAYWREPAEFRNPLIVEQPNTDFAQVIVRQFLHDAYALLYWQAMTSSRDVTLAALAGKAEKETAYHLRHSREWLLRLGDGTTESNRLAQAAIDQLLPFTGEMFRSGACEAQLAAEHVAPSPVDLFERWTPIVKATCRDATLAIREDWSIPLGGASIGHGDDFSHLVEEMQSLARAHPGATW